MISKILWAKNAWEDYTYWQTTNKQFVKKINSLIKDIQRHHQTNPLDGMGKPEKLKYMDKNIYSRRINSEHRLVYLVENDTLIISNARYHY